MGNRSKPKSSPFNTNFAIFEIEVNRLILFLDQQILGFEYPCKDGQSNIVNESQDNYPKSKDAIIHLNLGNSWMDEDPELEEGIEILRRAIDHQINSVKVFLSGDLEIAYNNDLITFRALEDFRRECLRIDSEEA